ncbi:MAG TPA: alpha/beta hydrolase [Nocardioidaceae bacterium]|nr:alpha/beta hydrolase [Nocardioidaceae bacterium]
MTADAVVDVLGKPYYAETIELPHDDEGDVVATLVSRKTRRKANGRAVLHVHGFADYFYQTPAADFWTERGYDFYALDLRKYGRSLLPHQTPNFALDLVEYYPELDEAYRRIMQRDAHEQLLVSAHSTGGLVTPLWLSDRNIDVQGVFLNSPWLDLQGSLLLRTAGTKAIDQVGARRPYQAIPRNVSGLYCKSLHKDFDGEWDFDLRWKPVESFPVYAGWLRAIRRGHARLHRGTNLAAPVLMLSSGSSGHPREMDATVTSTDIVLDVEQMWRWAPKLGRHVTMARIEGGLHDLTLSAEPVRKLVFDQLDRWLTAYVERS